MSAKYTKLSGYAVVGGRHYDITRVSVNYAIGRIPMVTVGVAAGQPAFSAGSGSTSLLETFSRRASMQVFIDASNPGVIPGGTGAMMIFDGETTSASISSEPGLRGINLSGTGWLNKLQDSGAFASHRSAHAFWELTPPVTMSSNAGITQPTMSIEGVAAALQDSGGDLFAVMNTLVKYIAGGTATKQMFNNASALQAWKRVQGSLTFGFGVVETVVSGVTQTAVSAFLSLYEGGVVFDSLMYMSSEFKCVLVPAVQTAYFVPYHPMYSTPAHKLTPEDYVYISEIQAARRNIAGLVLIDTISLTSSSEMQVQSPVAVFVVNEPSGVLDAAPLPAWLQQPVPMSQSANTQDIIAGLYGRTPVRIATKSESAITKRAKDKPKVDEVGNAYAQMELGDRLFGSNTVNIKGPFRTDIVPGTVISVGIPSDVARSPSTIEIFGYVQSVTLEVDAERGAASTSITLSHVRTEADNKAFGSSGSALYTTKFALKSLISNATLYKHGG